MNVKFLGCRIKGGRNAPKLLKYAIVSQLVSVNEWRRMDPWFWRQFECPSVHKTSVTPCCPSDVTILHMLQSYWVIPCFENIYCFLYQFWSRTDRNGSRRSLFKFQSFSIAEENANETKSFNGRTRFWLRLSLFWNVMQRVLVVFFSTFWTACGPHLKGPCSPRRAKAATTPRRDGCVLLPNLCLCPVSDALC